ncbi:MAG: hypothetical protein KBC78_02985 [Candidatus Pacebacteria bacterium]|jgi:predicted membrane channel-forming protein YqfA (hemolysin III family)|nr:hypothetical protein [Candidatus Paceibacterota bacterium]
MKKFLKVIWTIEHPMGEIWFFLTGAILLFVFGFIDFETLLDSVIPISLFAILILAIFLVSYKWQNRNKEDKSTNNFK